MKLSHHSKLWNLDQSTEVYFTMFPPQHENGQVRKKKPIYVRYAGTLEESVISNIHYSKWYSHSKDSNNVSCLVQLENGLVGV